VERETLRDAMPQGRFEDAAATFEASTERSTTWIGQQNIYVVGDCWLEAGRFTDALASYVRAARQAYVRRDTSTLSFQIEGAAEAFFATQVEA
jgi:hypothetical protein